MKKEWILQLVVLMLFYFDSIMEVHHEGIEWSDTPGIDLLFLLYHATLFFFVNYVLIPKFFYPKKYVLFFIALVGSIILFGIIEEEVVEKILSPNRRGRNDVDWQSIYWFFNEIAIPLLAFMTIKFMFDNFEQQKKLEQIEKDNLTNELKFLKSQIQPHILFNSLNNLYDFTLSKSDKAPDLVLKLANVLRYVLYETSTEKVKLSKEFKFLKDYIDLQQMQFEGRGVLEFDASHPNNLEELEIAPFLLIPFIENSVKHSLGTKEKNVIVKIFLEVKGKNIKLLVSNNFEKSNHRTEDLTTKGIGLKNVKKRLDLLYPNQYELSIQESNTFYSVQLELAL